MNASPRLFRFFPATIAFLGLIAAAAGQVSAPEAAWIGPANNAFAADLYARLASENGNLFFSPFSIETALAMTSAGARGRTEEQMRKVLQLPWKEKVHADLGRFLRDLNAEGASAGAANSAPSAAPTADPGGSQPGPSSGGTLTLPTPSSGSASGFQLTVANALWGQKSYPFLPKFTGLLKADYRAGMHAVDFVNDGDGACNLINNWVANETNGMIEELIPPGGLSKQTRLVLTNAIYFKGSWAAPFQAQATENQPFQLTSSEQATVPMMHATGEYGYMANDAIQALKLPYASGELSMIVLLPQAFDGLSDFEQTLTPATLAATLATFQNQTVAVSLPKFSLTTQFDATSIPEAMGMTAAFSTEANFSGITKSGGLFLSKVMHKAVIDVDEEGSVAAGATGIIAVTAVAIANPLSPIVFLANHPFLFLIRHEPTGTILFMGRLAEPAP